jgi:cytochrome oxidase Cu insertion factor (SCO1/SenC/PrrC family)
VRLRGSGPAAAAFALALMPWTGAAASAGGHEHPAPTVLAPGYSALEFEPPAPGSYALPPLGAAADGAVLDSAGRSRSLHDLMGDKVVVLSFIFTRCSDVNGCPLATYVLKGVQNRVLAAPDLKDRVRLLSLSFDPDYDTPEVLNAYATFFRAPAFDWHFLTAASEAELTPTLDAYGQWIIRDYDSNGVYLGTISHLLRVYLIDQDKRIRNIYSTSYLHADTVANDIRTLLEHRSPTRREVSE